MRRIITDSVDEQVQQDDGNSRYYYRKDYLHGGNNQEYSLALMYSRKAGVEANTEVGVFYCTGIGGPIRTTVPSPPASDCPRCDG